MCKDKICTNQDRQRRGHIFAQQMLNIPRSKGQPVKQHCGLGKALEEEEEKLGQSPKLWVDGGQEP